MWEERQRIENKILVSSTQPKLSFSIMGGPNHFHCIHLAGSDLTLDHGDDVERS